MSGELSTNDFESFLQLEDLKGNFKEDANKQLESYRADKPEPLWDIDEQDDPTETVDVDDPLGKYDDSFLFEDEDGYEDQEGEETDEDADDTDEEPESEDEEVVEDAVDEDGEPVEYEEGEAYDVDFDTIITLPDGRELSIEALTNGYVQGTDLTERETSFKESVAEFEERVAGMRGVLELSQLEADKVIADYEGFDWDALAASDPQAYVENNRFLERYKARKAELVAAQQRLQNETDAKVQEAYQAKCVECVQVLKKDIPNWDEPLYQNLLQYAIDLGADEQEVLKENRPSIFKALYKAYQFDKGKERVMAKIKRPGAPKKVIKTNAKPAPTGDKKAVAAKAYASGRMSQSDAFKFLED